MFIELVHQPRTTVLSLLFAIDGMMPLLQAAVDGAPNTAVPAA